MENINFKGFTQIDNSILFDSNLSADAKVFLMQINHILKTKQESFNPCKSWLLKVCGITKSMYEKVMKELKGFIDIIKTRKGSKYEYTYKILKSICTPVSKPAAAEPKEIKGQINIDEVPTVKKVKYNSSWKKKKENKFTSYDGQKEYDESYYDDLIGF